MTGLVLAGAAQVGALDLRVELRVAPGETVALLGPNGAGKTSLLRVLCGLLPLSTGELWLDGRLLDEPASRTFVAPEDRSIGMMFQAPMLFANLDVADNVGFGLRAAGTDRRRARSAAGPWLERVGLADRARSKVAVLSGGEAQRVALARALAAAPHALLLDEPLSALDAEVRAALRRDLRAHLAGYAGPRVLVTHDLLDAAVMADRVVVLEAGVVTDAGPLAELAARPRTPWVAELAGTNLLRARASGVRLDLVAGGSLLAAEAPGDGDVLVAIRPAAVALYARRPEGSPRNVWAATVAGVEGVGERVRVRLAGPVPAVAEITAAGWAALGMAPGSPVWVSLKATDLSAYPA